MIKKIYIDNFRCFSNFELRPGRRNLLIGSNGSGKTSLTDVIERLIALVLDGVDAPELFTGKDLTVWDSRREQRFELAAELEGRTFTYAATMALERGENGLVLREERVTCGDRTLFSYTNGEVNLHRNDGTVGTHFPFRGNRSFIAGIEERPETVDLMYFLAYLRNVRTYKLQPLGMASITHDENQRLAKDGSNFASWYRHLTQERAGDIPALFSDLARAIPGFRSLALRGAGKQGRTRDLIAQFDAQGGGSYDIDFDAISDGQRALVALYSLLVEISAGRMTVFMDEPENYVGLPELQPWLQSLDDALGDHSQIFLISHHPEVIDFLASESPIHFQRPDSGPVRVAEAEFDRESGLKASEQIARGVLDGE